MDRSGLMWRIRLTGNRSTKGRFCSALTRAGVGGWVAQPDIDGHPDLAFIPERVAVFLDDCYWHGCGAHFKAPRTRRAWWVRKIKANQERDARAVADLIQGGWKVFRVWEHDIADADTLRGVALRVARAADTPEDLQFGRAVDVTHSDYEPPRKWAPVGRHDNHHPIEQRAENAYDHTWRTWGKGD